MYPKLKFFCELPTPELQMLLRREPLIRVLKELHIGICLGTLEFSSARAQLVMHLVDHGVPVTAWLVLEDGLGANLENASRISHRYLELKSWIADYALPIDCIGLDFMPSKSALPILHWQDFRVLGLAMKQMARWVHFNQARKIYRSLAKQIHADGYRIETYQVPWVIDDRLAHSSLIQRALGVFDIRAHREVVKLDIGALRKYGPGLLTSYAKDATGVAVGEDSESLITPLQWDEIEMYFRYAWSCDAEIYIYSLEKFEQFDYLEKLRYLEWDQPILEPKLVSEKWDKRRARVQALIWFLNISPILLLGATSWFAFRRKRQKLS